MPEIGRLVAIIDGDLSGLERALGNAQKVLSRAGSQMSAAGRALSIGVTAPIVAIGGLAIKASMDFETAFAGVNKTVDASAAELDVLRQGIIDMSKEMPASAKEIAGVAEAAGQLGVKKGDILGFTRTMVMLGETTNLTATEAATSMAKIATVMQVPQKDIERLSSVLVDLGNNGNSTEREILDMATRIAGAGKTVGMSATDVLSLSNALASVGLEAEAGGTAVSRVLIEMANAAANLKPTEEQLKAIGDAQRDVRDDSTALSQAYRGVRDASEGVSQAQRGVRDASEAVTTAQRGVRDAAEGVAQAHRNTRNATETLVDAQRALVRVYRDAHQASLDARRETLSVAEAYQGLREVQSQAGSHALEVREAQLAVAEAHKRVREAAKGSSLEQQQASLGVERAQARLNQVQSQGGRYALDLQNAQLRVAEANARVGKSAEGYKDQILQAQRGVRNATEGVTEAQKGQRNATEGLQGAQKNLRNASEGVTDSQKNLRNAYENVGTAQNGVVTAQEKLSDSQAILNTLMDQSYGKLGSFAKLAGMLPEEFAALVKSNPSEAFIRVVEGLQRVQKEGGNVFKVLDDLGLGEIRVRDALLRAAGAGDTFRESLQRGRTAFDENTALTTEYGKRVETTAAQLQIMRNRVNANMIALGDELTPVLLEVSRNMGPLIGAFASLTALFAAAPGPVQTAVLGFLGFSAILGPTFFGLGQVFIGLKNVIGLAGPAKTAFLAIRASVMALSSALLTPPVGILVALIALGVAIYIFRDDIMKVLGPALAWAGNAAENAGKAIMGAFSAVKDFLSKNWREVATLISGPFAPLVLLATDAFGVRSAIVGAFNAIISYLGGLAGSAWGKASDFGWAIYDGMKAGLNSAIRAINSVIKAWNNLEFNLSTGVPGVPKVHVGTPDLPLIPALAKGTAFVPRDMLAQLHQGEMVIPARIAEQMRDVLAGARVPAYASTYGSQTPNFDQLLGRDSRGASKANPYARAESGVELHINGPLTINNDDNRKDSYGVVKDLGYALAAELRQRGQWVTT